MPAVAFPSRHISVEDYLDGEMSAEEKHEYYAGVVVAMAGASVSHNKISLNLALALKSHLRGGGCDVFVEGVKARLQVGEDDLFFYPDLMVACNPTDNDPFYRRDPKLVIEVLSESTELNDRTTKFIAYRQIAALEEYVLVSQDVDEPRVEIFRRNEDWQPVHYSEGDVELKSVDLSLPLAEIYEGV